MRFRFLCVRTHRQGQALNGELHITTSGVAAHQLLPAWVFFAALDRFRSDVHCAVPNWTKRANIQSEIRDTLNRKGLELWHETKRRGVGGQEVQYLLCQ